MRVMPGYGRRSGESGDNDQRVGIGSPDGSPIPSPERGSNFMADNEGNVVVSRLNEQMGMEIAQGGEGIYVRADNSNNAVRALEARLDELKPVRPPAYPTRNTMRSSHPCRILLVLLIVEVLIYDMKNPLFRNVRLFEGEGNGRDE